MSTIHPTAIIDPTAQLGGAVKVGPYAVIEADVVVGDGSSIGAHAVIKRYTRIGRRNQIFEHAVIGGDPQNVSFKPCVSHVLIGDNNVIREGVTIHRGSQESSATRMGDSNFLMAYAHLAHDCTIGNYTVFANGATLAGHVSVGDRVFISAFAAIHQFCRVGRLVMVSGLAGVTMDCLPFTIAAGNPARACGLNHVGLKRAGMSSTEIQELKRAYRVLLRSGLRFEQALAKLSASQVPLVQELVGFIQDSMRGFAHHRG